MVKIHYIMIVVFTFTLISILKSNPQCDEQQDSGFSFDSLKGIDFGKIPKGTIKDSVQKYFYQYEQFYYYDDSPPGQIIIIHKGDMKSKQ